MDLLFNMLLQIHVHSTIVLLLHFLKLSVCVPELLEVGVLDNLISFGEIKLEFLNLNPQTVMLLTMDTSIFHKAIDCGTKILNVQ